MEYIYFILLGQKSLNSILTHLSVMQVYKLLYHCMLLRKWFLNLNTDFKIWTMYQALSWTRGIWRWRTISVLKMLMVLSSPSLIPPEELPSPTMSFLSKRKIDVLSTFYHGSMHIKQIERTEPPPCLNLGFSDKEWKSHSFSLGNAWMPRIAQVQFYILSPILV